MGEAYNIKKSIHQSNIQQQEVAVKAIYDTLSPQMQCCADLATEKGASSVLPLDDHGFFLHKG